jgi:small subunit ribosomal protein S18
MAELEVKLPSAKKRRRRRRFERPKFCRFCGERGLTIDYKEPKNLRIFLTEEGKILPRRISGNCAKHQRKLTTAVKRARHLALLPLSPTHL